MLLGHCCWCGRGLRMTYVVLLLLLLFRLTTSSVAMTTSRTGWRSHIATCRCWDHVFARTWPSRRRRRWLATGSAGSRSRRPATPSSATRRLTSASSRCRTCARNYTPWTRTNTITSTRKRLSPKSTVHRLRC